MNFMTYLIEEKPIHLEIFQEGLIVALNFYMFSFNLNFLDVALCAMILISTSLMTLICFIM